MNTTNHVIKNYHDSSILLSVIEAREIIKNLTKELEDDIDDLGDIIEHEIEYYERCIRLLPTSFKQEQEPSAKINKLETKLMNVEQIMSQLIGGLFNHKKQSGVMNNHLAYLNGSKSSYSIGNESMHPTTRQGDANEEEIRFLKEKVVKLEETVNTLINLISERNK